MTRVSRAIEKGETQGFMKILDDAETKKIVGAAILVLAVTACVSPHTWIIAAIAVLALLFGIAFSAYATAEALSGGTIALTPIQIGALLNGNVLAGQENLGYALGLIMVVIIAIVMIIYAILQRRAARWLR